MLWPVLTRGARPRVLRPTAVVLGLCGCLSLMNVTHGSLPSYLRDRRVAAQVVLQKFKGWDSAEVVPS